MELSQDPETQQNDDAQVIKLEKVLKKIEIGQKLIREEFKDQKKRLVRRNKMLDAARAIMNDEFLMLHDELDELDDSLKKYLDDRNKFRSAMSMFMDLQVKGNSNIGEGPGGGFLDNTGTSEVRLNAGDD